MKKWLVVCAIVCGLTLPGCVLVFAPEGPFDPHGGPPPDEFEMREQELNERADHLQMWEQELREWQEKREEESGWEHEEEDPDEYEEEEDVDEDWEE